MWLRMKVDEKEHIDKAFSGGEKKLWPGTTQILCDGLMITSGATSWLWFTVVLVTLPLVSFLTFT